MRKSFPKGGGAGEVSELIDFRPSTSRDSGCCFPACFWSIFTVLKRRFPNATENPVSFAPPSRHLRFSPSARLNALIS